MSVVSQVKDCLCQNMIRVGALQKYHDVVSGGGTIPDVFAVFDEEENFLGLVGAKQATLFPGRVFSDLLIRKNANQIQPDMPLEALFAHFEKNGSEFVAVLEGGKFVGAVSESSLFAGLIKKLETELDYRKLATVAFENTSEGIMITDADSHIIHVNQAFSKTTGYPLDEVVGLHPNILHSGYHDRAFYDAMWKDLLETGIWEGELWNRRKNGDIYPEWLHINTVRNSEGEIVNYVGVFSDLGPNKRMQSELHQMAFYDPLTDLPNRRLFKDRLEQTIAQQGRENEGFALLLIDLNRFKNVNDAYGHAAGDNLLRQIAQRIREAVREADTVARLGGDEFTVILRDCHGNRAALAIAEKIVAALNEPIVLDGNKLLASATVGIALYPDDGATAEEITQSANAAMHHAKREDAEIRFYKSEMNSGLADQLALESAIRQGLAKGEFWLAWQPQIRLADGALSGAEVLARWRHEGSDIPPGKFIPIAERSGQIRQLGDWIFRTAMEQADELKKACDCYTPLQVAVNFSPLQLREEGAAQAVSEMLEKYRFDPGCLEVEITESAFMEGQHGARAFLDEIERLGVAVAIDDFGTGYSNLSNLKRFHIDKLKIDQSFVFDLTRDTASRQIVEATIKMAHSLGMVTLAEGVETREHADILREMGCDYAQGYFYSRPIPMSEFKKLCERCADGKICLEPARLTQP